MDHRKGPRRRGDELNQAIFTAALAEMTEVGYQRLTMERIAERARTSKASLYRRWPGRAELMMDAVLHAFPTVDDLPDTGVLRDDLLAALRAMAAALRSPLGVALRSVIAEINADGEAVRRHHERFIERRNKLMLDLLRRAAARGEVRPGALTPRVASVGPALMRDHFLGQLPHLEDEAAIDKTIIEIVDEVVVPLVRAT
ncbi:TetR/AcrR family transcriptional regulator [Kutzneria sp. CA-103260]|uniref:TetR/AcrR family transcriptional regulator n=1 Tax=Kutzneria sp. CA-103260 TaxID=2802641 RepID=UPI001BEEF8F4|nr:TetR/AcrR family transcriptional regulator [Kutzneria sp. CA-103260]QUQ71925.1 TetR family transcriptional regulator [Kutzneria sp. CA-103260]